MPQFTGLGRGARAYISGDNLGLWTPYSGYDPEVHSQLPGIAPRGIDYLHYPRPRTSTAGLRVAFKELTTDQDDLGGSSSRSARPLSGLYGPYRGSATRHHSGELLWQR